MNMMLEKVTPSPSKGKLAEHTQNEPFGESCGASQLAEWVRYHLPALQEMQKTWVQSLGQKDLQKEGMATHSSSALRIPWTEEPGVLQSTGSQSRT